MTVIERLSAKKNEFQNQHDALAYSSVPKSILKKKIEILDELIAAYRSTSSPASLSEAEKILNQQVGFEEQKREILESLEITKFREKKGIQQTPLILCLIGPTGSGKSTFAQILAQSLKKKFFSIVINSASQGFFNSFCSIVIRRLTNSK